MGKKLRLKKNVKETLYIISVYGIFLMLILLEAK